MSGANYTTDAWTNVLYDQCVGYITEGFICYSNLQSLGCTLCSTL